MCHPRSNTIMIACLLILVLSTISVQSQRRVIPAGCGKHVCQNIKAVIIGEPCVRNPPVVPKCNEIVIKKETVIPNTVLPAITVPVIPFIAELPTCPDICFNDILTTPLGCLDPILNVYGTVAVPMTELPVSPLLPAASPASHLASPFSKLFPPGCDCRNHFLDRLSIPPPFI